MGPAHSTPALAEGLAGTWGVLHRLDARAPAFPQPLSIEEEK